MSRISEFKMSQTEKNNIFIFDEMDIRAEAARDLAEPFELDGVKFEQGCDSDGTISVSGVDRLSEICGSPIKERVVKYRDGSAAVFNELIYNGIKFSELKEFHSAPSNASEVK